MAKKAQSSTSQTGLRDSLRNSKKADWLKVDAAQLQAAVASSAKVGGALRLGYSRDGGAYAIGVYGDGDPYTLYVGPDDDIEQMLVKIENAFAELA